MTADQSPTTLLIPMAFVSDCRRAERQAVPSICGVHQMMMKSQTHLAVVRCGFYPQFGALDRTAQLLIQKDTVGSQLNGTNHILSDQAPGGPLIETFGRP